MADQELIYDFINRFSDSSMFSDNIKFDYQLSFSERFVSIYCYVKFNYEKIITNNNVQISILVVLKIFKLWKRFVEIFQSLSASKKIS